MKCGNNCLKRWSKRIQSYHDKICWQLRQSYLSIKPTSRTPCNLLDSGLIFRSILESNHFRNFPCESLVDTISPDPLNCTQGLSASNSHHTCLTIVTNLHPTRSHHWPECSKSVISWRELVSRPLLKWLY